MNIELPEISKRLLAAGGAALIGLAALTACGGGEGDSGADGEAADETAEAAAEEGGEAAPATGDGTSPESPLPAGSTVEITDWTVTGTAVLDATEEVLAANEFNEPPAEGFQQGLVTLEGTYNGTESSSLWIDATFGIWADGTFYDSVDCLNTVENDLMEAPEVSGGSSSSGSSCVEVPADAETYLLYIEDLWSFEGTRYFIEIG